MMTRKAISSVLSPLVLVAGAAAFGAEGVASAQTANPNCPPGSWFCADTQAQPAAPAGQPVQPLQPLPAPGAQPTPPPGVQYQPPPPVVVYQPPPPLIYAPPTERPPPYLYTPRDSYSMQRNEWGVNAHLQGALLGGARDGGMGVFGFGVRYKPTPQFAIEPDLDFAGGRDFNGFQRSETAFALNALFFMNPRSHAPVYMLAGLGYSAAHATDDLGSGQEFHYQYFGGQLGVGVEFRVSRHFALDLDVRGFMRGRVDDHQSQPEFVDPVTGRASNTSIGALLNGGLTFYF
jgi:opacity protein-like surface antigen